MFFYDDVQYSKNTWRNRNKIKNSTGTCYLTVPVRQMSLSQKINNTYIDYSQKWIQKHFRSVEQEYRKSRYFEKYFLEYKDIVESHYDTISLLNRALTVWLCQCLSISTPLLSSENLSSSGSGTQRLIGILQEIGATTYLSGPAAAAYLDYALFLDVGINLEFKSYDYPPYKQLHGAFEPYVTVLDLLFNTGPEARNYLKSRTPDRLIVDRDGERPAPGEAAR